jgi:hypothetical protein
MTEKIQLPSNNIPMYQPHVVIARLLNGNQIFYNHQLDVWTVVDDQKNLVAILQV